MIVKTKEFATIGVRLVVYEDETRGGRIDLYEIGKPAEAMYEIAFPHSVSAVAVFNKINNNDEALRVLLTYSQ